MQPALTLLPRSLKNWLRFLINWPQVVETIGAGDREPTRDAQLGNSSRRIETIEYTVFAMRHPGAASTEITKQADPRFSSFRESAAGPDLARASGGSG